MSSGLFLVFYHNSLDRSISNSRVSGYFLLLLCFIEILVFNAYSVGPDQMPNYAYPIDICLNVSILIVLGFNDTSTHVGHFVSPPREKR